MSRYDDEFFGYHAEGSVASARVILPAIAGWLEVESVLDVGCGNGTWLKVWLEQGVKDVFGVDGDYVEAQSLMIPASNFKAVDLQFPFALGRRFDLVTCVEVAEHLPGDSAAALVECLCSHADCVLFSAAAPGQGGANHVNEQSYGYWMTQFAANQFRMLDCIRPEVRNDPRVERWYRYNLFLYVHERLHAALPERIKAATVMPGTKPKDISPLWYKFRKAVVRQMPLEVVNRVAAINERWTRL